MHTDIQGKPSPNHLFVLPIKTVFVSGYNLLFSIYMMLLAPNFMTSSSFERYISRSIVAGIRPSLSSRGFFDK